MTSDNNTIHEGPQRVDVFDTGQWRLVMHIGKSGIGAWIKHKDDQKHPLREMLKVDWKYTDDAALLSNIEAAVYSNPMLLDDYEANIIIETPKVMFAPKDVVEDEPDAFDMAKTVFDAEPDDVFTDDLGELVSIYAPCRGLKSFIDRTFPGAKVYNQLSTMIRRFSARLSDSNAAFCHLRDGEADIAVFRGETPMMAATHSYDLPEDAAYHVLNCLKCSGFDIDQTEVYLSGSSSVKNEVNVYLRHHVTSVLSTILPHINDYKALPLAAAIAVNLKIIY